MKILGIDSSSLVASVAVVEDNELIAEYTINYKKTHSQTLVPMLDEVKKMIDLDLKTLDGIAVAAGPGSFTGLRIGSATAKGLAQALQIPIASIPTMDGLAYNLYGTDQLICPIMDARRNQTYTGLYEFTKSENGYELQSIQPQCIAMIDEIIEQINVIGRDVIFLGDGVPVFQKVIEESCKVKFSFAPPTCNRQRGASIASLGLDYMKQGNVQEAKDHEPDYLRLSQAERERKEAMEGSKC